MLSGAPPHFDVAWCKPPLVKPRSVSDHRRQASAAVWPDAAAESLLAVLSGSTEQATSVVHIFDRRAEMAVCRLVERNQHVRVTADQRAPVARHDAP